jgi:hypothetical protein
LLCDPVQFDVLEQVITDSQTLVPSLGLMHH